jgi:hypothetical protein
MKKIIAMFVVICMAFVAFSFASAQEPVYCTPNPPEECAWRDNFSICNINTEVVVAGGGGGGTGNTQPVIKAKWEYDLDVSFLPEECEVCGPCIDENCLETGYWVRDACPCIDGLQVLPILGGAVKVGYFAAVTDDEGISTLEHVYADVWHPDGEFKYQIELFPLTKQGSLDAFAKVIDCYPTLVAYNEPYFTGLGITDFDTDIEHELSQDLALVYYGEALISYCQPGGYYTVGVRAHDNFNEWSEYLYNQFWYIPTTAINIDFTQVNYGNAVISAWQWASGDQDMGTNAYPTIQNWGNTPVNLYVWQDDMDFSTTINQQGVEEWNVEFDARLGSDGVIFTYDPFENEDATHKGVFFGNLALCTLEKADFSIHVKKADPGNSYTGNMCILGYRDANPVWPTPADFIGNSPGTVIQDIYNPDPSQAGPGESST